MAANRRDRSHFALIAAAMKAEKEEQRREALQSTARERIAAGILLGAVLGDAAVAEALDRRAAAQIGLARKRPSAR
jgi:hypothetical protein